MNGWRGGEVIADRATARRDEMTDHPLPILGVALPVAGLDEYRDWILEDQRAVEPGEQVALVAHGADGEGCAPAVGVDDGGIGGVTNDEVAVVVGVEVIAEPVVADATLELGVALQAPTKADAAIGAIVTGIDLAQPIDFTAGESDTFLRVEIERAAPESFRPPFSLVSNPILIDVGEPRDWRGPPARCMCW